MGSAPKRCRQGAFTDFSLFTFPMWFSYKFNMNVNYEQVEKQARQLSLTEKGTLARVLSRILENADC